MKWLSTLAALAATTVAAPSTEKAATSPLDVTLQHLGNATLKFTITNKGNETQNILKPGSLLSDSVIDKVRVFAADSKTPLPYNGVHLVLRTQSFEMEDFARLDPNQQITTIVNPAETHDLSSGGNFTFQSTGYFAIGDEQGILVKSVPYTSNPVTAEVNGAVAGAVHSDILAKRVVVQNYCQSQRRRYTLKPYITSNRSTDASLSNALAQ
ncbi:7alpha-cephem-methoxylase P8 chain related protein [Purpureocillium lavendulum]|uniref:7alpha-cephem-methoxylase P8 chain related protein n=1 Tax=Purpureocillium lavendulum TaxID=1247861 RepID=A0AB34FKS0_9HYPO|nr:7alpha-cephem-methoxylase P8 chain related protein [Purpureocillium lavendulum]